MRAPFALSPEAVEEARVAYRAPVLPSIVLPSLIAPALAAGLRAAGDAIGYRRFDFAPQGRFDRIDPFPAAPLLDPLRALAEAVTGERFTVGGARLLRLAHRDYALLWEDALTRPPARFVEALIDLSEAASGEAEVAYCAGANPIFTAPQLPGSAILVERAPGVLRWQRYLSHRVGAKKIHRLLVELLPATGN